jgi:hypothetical protein
MYNHTTWGLKHSLGSSWKLLEALGSSWKLLEALGAMVEYEGLPIMVLKVFSRDFFCTIPT